MLAPVFSFRRLSVWPRPDVYVDGSISLVALPRRPERNMTRTPRRALTSRSRSISALFISLYLRGGKTLWLDYVLSGSNRIRYPSIDRRTSVILRADHWARVELVQRIK